MLELLILVIFLCVMLAAYINLSYYKSRKKILKELLEWLQVYKQYVNFQQLSYNEIVHKTIGNMSQSLKTMTKTPISYDNIPYTIDKSQKTEIVDILSNFGKGDIIGEMEYIEMCITKVDKMCINSADTYKTKGVLRSKLIIIFGIAFLILLI